MEEKSQSFVSLSQGHCNDVCIHGFCDSDGFCSCYEGWAGDYCSSLDTVDDDEYYYIYESPEVPLPHIFAIIVIFILLGIVLVILIALVANYVVKKKRARNLPEDTLFTMLAQEQDLDTL